MSRVVVYTVPWAGHEPAEGIDDPATSGAIRCRVVVDGHELRDASGVAVRSSYDFQTVDVRLNGTVEFRYVTQEEFDGDLDETPPLGERLPDMPMSTKASIAANGRDELVSATPGDTFGLAPLLADGAPAVTLP